jgi:catechol 2,3-dioxygenase-like lactoylglutathione lyase family enzyme
MKARTEPSAKGKSADLPEKAGAVYVYLSVDDIDAFHKELLAKGLKPASEPRDWPSGNREFVLRDPDGYNLVIFKRK